MSEDAGHHDFGWHRGYHLYLVEDEGRMRGYAVPGDEADSQEAFAISDVSAEALERRLRVLVDEELDSRRVDETLQPARRRRTGAEQG